MRFHAYNVKSIMLELEDLRNRNPRAWTQLLTQDIGAKDVIVEAVGEEPLDEDGDVSRFLLSLAGYNEPIGLVGKRTNAIEALFYEQLRPNFPHFTPKCYFSHVGLDDGWLVLAEVRNDHPPETWTASDIEILIGMLASLHAPYWGKGNVLEEYGLPSLLVASGAQSGHLSDESPDEQPLSQMERIERWLQGQRRPLTEHAKHTAGPTLTPLLNDASEGLETLRQYGGWPGIVDSRHLTALADLLDDPMPVLYPLRELPETLLHGSPSLDRWRLSIFDDYYLLDWRATTIGPGVYDLVRFIDHASLIADRSPGENLDTVSRTAEETMVDSYVLAMRGELGTRFDARATRQAVPAARCLLVLTHWLPRLGNWLNKMNYQEEVWQTMNELPDTVLQDAGMSDLLAWRRSLALIFDRFLRAYRRL